MTLQVGDPAPEFELLDQDGNPVRLRDFRGRKVVLYFYPKDDTAGCTAEACGIRDEFPRFESAGAVVLGVSPDEPKTHARFRDKYQLPFTLLADSGREAVNLYGVWGPRKYMGREYLGVTRTTFLIDEEGRIERIFNNVKPAQHPLELLKALGAP